MVSEADHSGDILRELPDCIDFEKTASFYATEMKRRIRGPQLEGLAEDWLRDALADPNTKVIDIGEGIVWPIFVPIGYNQDYSKRFYSEHFPDQPVYYLSTPPEGVDYENNNLVNVIGKLREENAVVAYDTLDSDTSEGAIPDCLQFDSVIDVTPDSSAFGKQYGQPTVTHFEGTVHGSGSQNSSDVRQVYEGMVSAGEYESWPRQGPVLLTPDLLRSNEAILEQIWSIYDAQFSVLVEDHPSLQMQPREEIEAMLLDEDSFNVAYIDDDKVVALCYFVGNIAKCPWLNQEFFKDDNFNGSDSRILYFPGIVVDPERARMGMGYADDVIRLMERVHYEANITKIKIVFQCTNVSSEYIPKIVTGVISGGEGFNFDTPPVEGSSFTPVAKYIYKCLSFKSS